MLSNDVQMPEKIVLGTILKPQGTGAKRRVVKKDETMMYIPILKTLESLLQNDSVLAEVLYIIVVHVRTCVVCKKDRGPWTPSLPSV